MNDWTILTRNYKVDAFSIESLLGRKNSSRTMVDAKLAESSLPKVSNRFCENLMLQLFNSSLEDIRLNLILF
uniref:Uncharacterized protein n=1 Tax=Elaeophora elaphi TaxID=1147741 RepID=A0A0R3RWE7_9BILA